MASWFGRLAGKADQIPLYEGDGFDELDDPAWQRQDWLTFTARSYGLAAATAPFQLAETLLQVQYRGSEQAEGQLPALSPGIVKPLRQVLEYDHFGYTTLFRGHFITFLQFMAEQILQPNLEELMLDLLDVFEDTDPGINIATNMVVGGLLNPLELARTRLIVQATHDKKAKYVGLFHCLATIANEEGGVLAWYSPRHFLPSLFYHALRPGLRLLSGYAITHVLNLTTTFNPVTYRLCQAALLALETAVLAPWELARKRLYAQAVPHRKRRLIPSTPNVEAAEKVPDPSYPTVVAVSAQPYAGVLDVFLRVSREEGPAAGEGVVDRARSFWVGYTSLYRGFWPMYARSLVIMAAEEAERVNSEYSFL
ncbi:mitochondrial carrier domain-containing protein [Hyaloraphidium curvatum]|nr:mitochondrial carrier domain-containing protein [Hyaloraphidium curvatum]